MKTAYLIIASVWLCACSTHTTQIILDTDCGPDYDDIGAMATMYALQLQGKCKVLAVMSSNKHELVVPTIDVINTYYGFSDMPVGEVKTEGVNIAGWHKQSWAQFLVDKYKPQKRQGNTIPDAVSLYRKLLSEAKDKSVVICSIGFLTNLSNLLNSQGDEYSPMTGKELVATKVDRLVVMGGGFPSGNEFNLKEDIRSSDNVATTWPTPIYFCGFEIGEKVITGKSTSEMNVDNSPVVDAYRVALKQDDPKGRNSWDQVTVLSAIEGTEPYFTLKQGRIIMESDGKNSWQEGPDGCHYYMIPKIPYDQLSERVEQLMKVSSK